MDKTDLGVMRTFFVVNTNYKCFLYLENSGRRYILKWKYRHFRKLLSDWSANQRPTIWYSRVRFLFNYPYRQMNMFVLFSVYHWIDSENPLFRLKTRPVLPERVLLIKRVLGANTAIAGEFLTTFWSLINFVWNVGT